MIGNCTSTLQRCAAYTKLVTKAHSNKFQTAIPSSYEHIKKIFVPLSICLFTASVLITAWCTSGQGKVYAVLHYYNANSFLG